MGALQQATEDDIESALAAAQARVDVLRREVTARRADKDELSKQLQRDLDARLEQAARLRDERLAAMRALDELKLGRPAQLSFRLEQRLRRFNIQRLVLSAVAAIGWPLLSSAFSSSHPVAAAAAALVAGYLGVWVLGARADEAELNDG